VHQPQRGDTPPICYSLERIRQPMDSNIDKNHLVIMKNNKTGQVRFFGSLKTGWLQFKKSNFEKIEKPKKSSHKLENQVIIQKIDRFTTFHSKIEF
jgi:hypothetical protein